MIFKISTGLSEVVDVILARVARGSEVTHITSTDRCQDIYVNIHQDN